jgi:hypothetical protein
MSFAKSKFTLLVCEWDSIKVSLVIYPICHPSVNLALGMITTFSTAYLENCKVGS